MVRRRGVDRGGRPRPSTMLRGAAASTAAEQHEQHRRREGQPGGRPEQAEEQAVPYMVMVPHRRGQIPITPARLLGAAPKAGAKAGDGSGGGGGPRAAGGRPSSLDMDAGFGFGCLLPSPDPLPSAAGSSMAAASGCFGASSSSGPSEREGGTVFQDYASGEHITGGGSGANMPRGGEGARASAPHPRPARHCLTCRRAAGRVVLAAEQQAQALRWPPS